MTTPFKIGLTAFILACSQLAEAQTIGQSSYGGTGCQDGTVSVTTDEADASIAFKLDAMEVLIGDQTGAVIERKACALSISIEVPEGQQLEAVQAVYDGAAVVAEDASIKIQTEHFLAGSRGRLNKLTLESTEGSSFGLAQVSQIESECGKAVQLRANFSMLAQTQSSKDSLTAGMLDQVKYKLVFKNCEQDALL